MRARAAAKTPIPAGTPRAQSECLAIAYLHGKHIPCLPGKAYQVADVDILAWGCVRIEVKYSTIRHYNHCFTFGLTQRQRQRGLLADVVLLICDYGDRQTFHLLEPDDPVFYFKDGRRKGGFTFTPGQMQQKKHAQNRITLTQPRMDEAQDRIDLIEAARLAGAARLE